jgi:transaldolase
VSQQSAALVKYKTTKLFFLTSNPSLIDKYLHHNNIRKVAKQRSCRLHQQSWRMDHHQMVMHWQGLQCK